MELQSLAALEWPKLLEHARSLALTSPGARLLEALADPRAWAQNAATSNLRQAETAEVIALLDREAIWAPLSGLLDIEPSLEKLDKSGVLELAEIVAIRSWLYAADSWSAIPREEIRGEKFKKTLSIIPSPFAAIRSIERVITPDGEISERASPKLASLNAEIRSLKREIQAVMDQSLKAWAQRGVLQEDYIDVRDGRYVLPVRISSQSEVDGIIYEASASRQTVFVEPREVSLLSNRLRQRQNDLIAEIYEILRALCKELAPFSSEIRQSVHWIAHWDAVHARALLGRSYGGKTLEVTEERTIRLFLTAHPLLYWSLPHGEIIRNQIDFGDPARTLLITGPNTGGKTVFLKTLGLAGVCARTGFTFPAADTPVIPYFDRFFVDVGDPQSIEQHLSSFSGHVLRFKAILDTVTDKSLVLLDELNSATDPEEGAALGRAFLETLMERGAVLVATTHDPRLKALAIQDKRIVNASMEFNEASRTPTYRMAIGVPGRSRALETAERLGIPASILNLARSYLTREHNEFERVLAKLESDIHETARAKREAVVAYEEADKLRKEWLTRTQGAMGELMDRTRQRLRRILEQAQDEVRASVRKLDEARHRKDVDTTRGSLNRLFTDAAERIESALQDEAPQVAELLEREAPVKKTPSITSDQPTPLEVGARVRIPKWKSTGIIAAISQTSGGPKYKVTMGSIQMTLGPNEIEALKPSEIPKTQSSRGSRGYSSTDVAAPASGDRLDLRGMRLDDAMSELERYLDQAYRSGSYVEVTIVHGLGTGALREGARKIIGSLPYIKEYRDGGAGGGGTGATLITFDR